MPENPKALNQEIRNETIRLLEEYEKASKSIRYILRERFLSTEYSSSYRSVVESLCLSIIRYLNTIDFLIIRGLKPGMKRHLDSNDITLTRLALYEVKWLKQSFETIRRYYPSKISKIVERALTVDLDQLIAGKPMVNQYSIKHSHPTFFIETILQNMTTENALRLLEKNNSGYPYYIRPNFLLDGYDDFQDILQQIGVEIRQDSDYPKLFQVLKGIDKVVASDQFAKGRILIQEKGSVAIINALGPKPGDTIWDACAAPGQKTQLICEAMNQQGRIIASDIYPNRLHDAIQNTDRLGCQIIEWVLTDASKNPVKDTNRVLIDAPCSSTGILYSHPSFKWRLNKESLFSFMAVQNKILDGILYEYKNQPETEFVYATCSVLPHEGESQIDSVMQRHSIQLLDITGPGTTGYPGFHCSSKVRRLFPHLHECGGFFIARFKLTC